MRIRLTYLLFLFAVSLAAQDLTPIVKQFGKTDYAAANQNWAVAQGNDGRMYFGNNQGLLEFDGNQWELIRMPQNKLVRSVYIDANDRIYVGSFEEFGYFERQSNGRLLYTSLSDSLENYSMTNDEIWTILEINNRIVFQSFTSYFTLYKGQVEGHRHPVTFLFFTAFGKEVMVNTQQQGLCRLNLETHKLSKFPQGTLKGSLLSLLPLDGRRFLAVTVRDGLYYFDGQEFTPFRTNAEELMKELVINRAMITREGHILLGTIQHGLVAFNKEGKRLWMVNRSNVLQNNTVLGLTADTQGNVWVALDKGIAYMQLNSEIRYVNSFQPPLGAIYDIKLKGEKAWLATNQGLFKGVYRNNSFQDLQLIEKVKGQVWHITDIDDQLFVGNNEMTYEIVGDEARTASPVQGGFCMSRGKIHGRDVLVQGTYTQLCVYFKKDGRWQFSHAVDGFVNPVRYLEIDYTGRIWASHLHQGLFSIELSQDFRNIERINSFDALDGENKYNVNVFSINNRVVFTDHHSFYTFDDIDKKIIPYRELNERIGHAASAYRVSHFKSNYYWFIRDTEASLYQISDAESRLVDIVHYSMFRSQTVDDYQQIVAVSDSQCMLTLENGVALYSADTVGPELISTNLKLKLITVLNSSNQKSRLLSLHPTNKPPVIPFKENNVGFEVYFPDFTQMNNVQYRFKLNGLDKSWGEPGLLSRKVYDYLPQGNYVLYVEVLSNSGLKLSELQFAFIVAPPFYWSLFAKIIYVLLLILLVLLTVRFVRKKDRQKHLRIQKEKEALQQHEIEQREQEIVALKNERLEAELTLKSKELAESTMTLITKNEMLARIREEVVRQKNALGTQYPNKYADKLLKMIDENITSEDDWARFEANFDRIHENFFRHLHRDYPELTSNDLRFCAYLRLNLSSKDIAHLMNITLKGVEVARYRIRKKIQLPSSKSLTEFMIEFK